MHSKKEKNNTEICIKGDFRLNFEYKKGKSALSTIKKI